MTDPLPEVRVKICGLTRREDAELAADLGAAYLGFVFAPSPRRADPEELRAWLPGWRKDRPTLRVVGVFVPPLPARLDAWADELGLDLFQVHASHGSAASESVASTPDADTARRAGPVRRWIRAVRPEALPGALRGTTVASTGAAFPMSSAPASAIETFAWLVDTPSPSLAGGTGRTFDWSLLPAAPRPYRLFLAGGLAAENVGEAIGAVRPYAVDASSRLETAPGIKDAQRLRDYFRAIAVVARPVASEAPAGAAGPRGETNGRWNGEGSEES